MTTEVGLQPQPNGCIRLEERAEGSIWHVYLATPKANILDAEKIGLLTKIFERAKDATGLKAIILEGEGSSFSYGASVDEHLPEQCEKMIREFHCLFRTILEAPVTTLAAVRGQCLGGALELASFCTRVFAALDAKLGQPEIVLGVLAPVACVSLPGRIGRTNAEELCMSGRVIGAEEAYRIGLVDQLADDPSEAALNWARKHLLPHSASSLRQGMRALRITTQSHFEENLARVERLYLKDLMCTHDAVEGLRAFLDKRQPEWKDA